MTPFYAAVHAAWPIMITIFERKDIDQPVDIAFKDVTELLGSFFKGLWHHAPLVFLIDGAPAADTAATHDAQV